MRQVPLLLVTYCGLFAAACVQRDDGSLTAVMNDLRTDLEAVIGASGVDVGVYYHDLGTDAVLDLNADLRMHAASTMKVPVMMQLFRDHSEGRINLDDSVQIRNEFASIVDGSPYQLTMADDSDTELYALVGQVVSVRSLVDRMITRSSNLATNLVIDLAGAERVTAMCRLLGADSIDVLRGVEDIKAFRAGLSNTTTARDLGVLLSALARGQVADQEGTNAMIDILSRQEHNRRIPAGLPIGTRVAHKTGWITGIDHDAAIVFPEGASPYVLVLMVRGIEDEEVSAPLMARMSQMVYEATVKLRSARQDVSQENAPPPRKT